MKLRPYQHRGLRLLVTRHKAALFWEMRLGKTVTAMKAIKVLKAFPCLIVAPYSALLSWQDEIGEDNLELLFGKREKRIERIETSERKWFWINIEGHKYLPELCDYIWGSIIIDESTCLKNPKAKVSRFYVDNFKDVPIKFILTGIPAPESDLEYIQQLRFIDAIDMNYWKFRNKYCGCFDHKYIMRKSGKQYLARVLQNCASFMKLRDANLGAEKIYQIQSVELLKNNRKRYLEIIDELKINENKMTIFKTVAWIWARQFLGGFINDDFVNDAKLLLLNTLLYKQLPLHTGKIIFASFTREVYFISHTLQKKFAVGTIIGATKVEERKNLVRKFQSGKLKILVCQPEVVRHGLNLSNAGEVIFYSSPVSLETRYQCEARAALRRSLLIIDLVTHGTLEEDIVKSLRRKETRSQMIERIVRRLQA